MSKEKVKQIIENAPVAFMATIDGDTPRVRPMAAQVVWDDKLYVSTFKESRKMGQLSSNPKTEISWMDKEMRHVRISGSVVVCEDEGLRKKYFEENPMLKNYFSGLDDPNYTLLEIAVEKVEWMDTGVKEYEEVTW